MMSNARAGQISDTPNAAHCMSAIGRIVRGRAQEQAAAAADSGAVSQNG